MRGWRGVNGGERGSEIDLFLSHFLLAGAREAQVYEKEVWDLK